MQEDDLQYRTMRPLSQVADFGMSMNIRGNKTHVSGVRHGTPMYISPEIVRNGKASKAADVYSFGVMMWELCHGMLAWQQVRTGRVNLCSCGAIDVCRLCPSDCILPNPLSSAYLDPRTIRSTFS